MAAIEAKAVRHATAKTLEIAAPALTLKGADT
jgi:hypothetical protein